jgi:ribosomal protein S18 acetylase RimI-like enzyme
MTDTTIIYSCDVSTLDSSMLDGFFCGWANRPSAETHLRILRGSNHVVLALDGNRVVGFINAISDGFFAASIPLLEVLPNYRGRGIGSELVRRMLGQLSDFYCIDVACDPPLQAFYEKLGLQRGVGVMRRNYHRQSTGAK